MKLAIDCRFIGKSGIGTYIENVVAEFLERHPENQYLLLMSEYLPEYGKYDNVTIQIVRATPFSIRELFAIDCNKINSCDAYFSPYINIPFGIKVPIFSTIHDVIFLDMPILTSTIGRGVRWCFYKHAIACSRKVFTVSKFSRERIKVHFKKVPPIVVTYSAISKYVKEAAISPFITKNDYFVYIGNIKEHKGIDVLLSAFEVAQSKGLSSELYIVGEKDNFRTSNTKIEKSLSNPKIHFTGYLDNKKLVDILRTSKALVLPSRYEGLGLPPMEALYLGTNAIISDIPVFKEIYSKLPVTFFRKDNVSDLSECLLGSYPKAYNQKIIKDVIDSTYNFEIISDKILKEILITL